MSIENLSLLTTPPVIKEHTKLPLLIDITSRKMAHHIDLRYTHSPLFLRAFAELFAHQLKQPNIPRVLQQSSALFIDETLISEISAIEKKLQTYLHASECTLVFLPAAFVELLSAWITSATHHEHIRLVIYDKSQKDSALSPQFFTKVCLDEPTHAEQLTLLKSFRSTLENFHEVMISEETFSQAFHLATHYLSRHAPFDEALRLLDTASARASSTPPTDLNHKPIVTNTQLLQIISQWTKIPLANLQQNTFQSTKFVTALQKQIIGQDAAINLMGSLLQNASIKLYPKAGPLCSFLLAGAPESGKKATAEMMADHLFGHSTALIRVNLHQTDYTSLQDMTIIPHQNSANTIHFLTAVRETPYAVILLERIDLVPKNILELFHDIFIQGYVTDTAGQKYDFAHTIFVMTTTFGTETITQLTKPEQQHETTKAVDLMQLVLNPTTPEQPHTSSHTVTPQVLAEELQPKLIQRFPSALLHQVNIIPFLPLDFAALEKIIKQKTKRFARQLETNFGIDLSISSEVTKFLAHELFWQRTHAKRIDALLEQQLYTCVIHEILANTDNKHRSKRMLVQLNDTGQLLRCEFVSVSDATFQGN